MRRGPAGRPLGEERKTVEAIRAVLSGSPFHGEGHHKFRAEQLPPVAHAA
jgi:hypothetical protein